MIADRHAPPAIIDAQPLRMCILRDPAIQAMPEYGPADIQRAVDGLGPASFGGLDDLVSLSRSTCDVLIISHLTGTWSEASMTALVDFHRAGGGIVILGAMPHQGSWYPLRNGLGYRLHLTTCPCTVRSPRLTVSGRSVLGDIPDFQIFAGMELPANRLSAWGPDLTYDLVTGEDIAVTDPTVIAVERRGEFLGARLAAVGCSGGEPRENADHAFQLPWQWNPGFLNRAWSGCDTMVRRLTAWCRPPHLAVTLDSPAVAESGSQAASVIRVRNTGTAAVDIGDVQATTGGATAWSTTVASRLEAGCEARWEVHGIASTAGIHHLVIDVHDARSNTLATHVQDLFRLPADHHVPGSFGASTYWSFARREMPIAYVRLVRDLVSRGCQYLRVNLPWEDVEPEPGVYDWTVADRLVRLAHDEGLQLRIWMFPTTRGSGLSDGGVPRWILREPAIDRQGTPGFFPSLWSPFYRERYFALIEALTARYAHEPVVERFVIDFGNSDFMYGYNYYGGDPTIFDYSPFEQRVFAAWMQQHSGMSLEQVGGMFGTPFARWSDIPVPVPAQTEAWAAYARFRRWSVKQGIEEVARIVARNASGKVPVDPPGHGMGSIAELEAYHLDAHARHFAETSNVPMHLRELHNSGPAWGGEPWQVGNSYREYDEHLFSSVRLGAAYFTIPGPDLGYDTEGIARIGFIRRMLAGSRRPDPVIAIYDDVTWSARTSLAQVGACLDHGVDLLHTTNRHDLSCYRVLVLPHRHPDVVGQHVPGHTLPVDQAWYDALRQAIQSGLTVIVFPGTLLGAAGERLRRALDIPVQAFGDRRVRQARRFGNLCDPTYVGQAAAVHLDGRVLVEDADGQPICVQKPCGHGAVICAGWDREPDSWDGALDGQLDTLHRHTLVALLDHLGLEPGHLRTRHARVRKEVLQSASGTYAVFFSYLPQPIQMTAQVRLTRPSTRAIDLATGATWPLIDCGEGWYSWTMPVVPRRGIYLAFHDQLTST